MLAGVAVNQKGTSRLQNDNDFDFRGNAIHRVCRMQGM
jgi:hypothetical protein